MREKVMNKKNLLVAVVIIVALGIAVYFFVKADLAQTPTVRIGYLDTVTSLPVFIAKERGLFRAEGIEYKTIAVSSSNQIVDGILSGAFG